MNAETIKTCSCGARFLHQSDLDDCATHDHDRKCEHNPDAGHFFHSVIWVGYGPTGKYCRWCNHAVR